MTIQAKKTEGATIGRAKCEPTVRLPGVELRKLAAGRCGVDGFSTGIAHFAPGAGLPCHTHTFSEIITVLSGECRFIVEGRVYRLGKLDAMHVPHGTPHHGNNGSSSEPLLVHWTYSTAIPTLSKCDTIFQHLNLDVPAPENPERLCRFEGALPYELTPGTSFRDLFSGRMGCPSLCGGYAEFQPGASLPCHIHKYDESICIIGGRAICEVAGCRSTLSDCDTAMVPEGLPHRFLNEFSEPMVMIWVYAGDEPGRTLVETGYCTGSLF